MAVVVPTMKLSALSSQAIIALLPVDPLSIRIPESLEAAPVRPWFNSTKLSVTARLVVFIVVVVPLTVRLPATTISLGKPIVIVPELSATSTSFAVPENVAVPPKAIAVELEPSETVIEELLNFALPILPASLSAAVSYTHLTLPTICSV